MKNHSSTAASSSVVPSAVLEKIESRYASLSTALRTVADYILLNPATFCFLTVQELAKQAGVSHATVIRLCKYLGYKGFQDFSREVQDSMRAGLSSAALSSSWQDMFRKSAPGSVIREVLEAEVQSLLTVAERVDEALLDACVDILVQADRISILGLMASASLSRHLHHMLSKVADNVQLLPEPSSMFSISQMQHFTPNSALIVYAFPRYPAVTIEQAETAKKRGARIIVLTNSQLSPVARLADLIIPLPVPLSRFVDLYAAPAALNTAIAIAYSRRDPDRTGRMLDEIDGILTAQGIFNRN